MSEQVVKDLYELGEIPPLGHVPQKMYAWAIRRERHGNPDTATKKRRKPHKGIIKRYIKYYMKHGGKYNILIIILN